MRVKVLSERDTVEQLASGPYSLARFGDGELSLMIMNRSAPGQRWEGSLVRRLRELSASTLPFLIVAIPRIFEHIPEPKRENWERWTSRKRTVFWNPEREYGSAFIGRPDFYGPDHRFGADYWALMRSIWQDQPVLLVRGDQKIPALFDNAASIEVLVGPPRDAWERHPLLLARAMTWANSGPPGIVCMQLGPTATVLAYDLAVRGVRALDLGKATRFYRDEMLAGAG